MLYCDVEIATRLVEGLSLFHQRHSTKYESQSTDQAHTWELSLANRDPGTEDGAIWINKANPGQVALTLSKARVENKRGTRLFEILEVGALGPPPMAPARLARAPVCPASQPASEPGLDGNFRRRTGVWLFSTSSQQGLRGVDFFRIAPTVSRHDKPQRQCVSSSGTLRCEENATMQTAMWKILIGVDMSFTCTRGSQGRGVSGTCIGSDRRIKKHGPEREMCPRRRAYPSNLPSGGGGERWKARRGESFQNVAIWPSGWRLSTHIDLLARA